MARITAATRDLDLDLPNRIDRSTEIHFVLEPALIPGVSYFHGRIHPGLARFIADNANVAAQQLPGLRASLLTLILKLSSAMIALLVVTSAPHSCG